MLNESFLRVHAFAETQELVSGLTRNTFVSIENCLVGVKARHDVLEELCALSEEKCVANEGLEEAARSQVIIIRKVVDLEQHVDQEKVRAVSLGLVTIFELNRLVHVVHEEERYLSFANG